jgi:hypothetical protein
MSLNQKNTIPDWYPAAWRSCTGYMCKDASYKAYIGEVLGVMYLDSSSD